MNIADKVAFYREVGRVLKPGGRFTSTEMAAGAGGPPHFPLPWARDPAISFLATQDEMRAALEAAGLRITAWRDTTEEVVAVAQAASEQARLGRLGVGLVAGADFPERMANTRRSIAERRLSNVMIVATKPL